MYMFAKSINFASFLTILYLILDVPSHETERLCICVLDVSVMYLCVIGICYVFMC